MFTDLRIEMNKPSIQIENEIREMTDEEYAVYLHTTSQEGRSETTIADHQPLPSAE